MRRVVVTGLGMVSPLGCGVEVSWKNLLAGKSGGVRIVDFPVDDLACQIACRVPRGPKIGGPVQSRRLDGAEGAAQGRRLHHLRDGRRRPGARRRRLASRDLRRPVRHRRADRIGHRRHRRHLRCLDHAVRARPAPHQPVLHSGPADQPRLRPGLDPPRPQGPEPFGRHRLLDRRPRHRRRLAADRARRCRRDGRGRDRIAGEPAVDRRLRRLPRALHRLQRPARPGVAAL